MTAFPRSLVGLMWLLCVMAAQAAPLQDDASPDAWLARMVSAGQQGQYTGRAIFMSGTSEVISLEIRHAVFDGEAWERIVHLSQQPAEILRRGQKVTCLHPDSQAEFRLGQISSSLQQPFKREDFVLPEHYRLVKGGEGRVAGRKAWQLDILPVDRLRYGYRLWLDQQTALLLKSVTLDQRGESLELFEFVQIDLETPLTKADFEPGESLQRVEAATDVNATTKTAVATASELPTSGAPPAADSSGPTVPAWRLNWLPRGFTLAANEMRPLTDPQSASRVYSDGLAAFTIFLEPVQASSAQEGSQAHGATIAVSRQVLQDSRHFLVTIVGEVPMETAIQVAASVQID